MTRPCPESVTGHGLTDRTGRCPWCRRKIEAAQPAYIRARPNRDHDDVIDPLTLEPVDPHERADRGL